MVFAQNAFLFTLNYQEMKNQRRTGQNPIMFIAAFILLLAIVSCVNGEYRESVARDPITKFEPIPVERANGFYETTGYQPDTDYADVELRDEPSITLEHIKKIEKSTRPVGEREHEIDLFFTEEGSRKLYSLTKENIGKPIALVVDNQIIYMPKVMAGVVGGKVSICTGYSEDEIDRMIETLEKAL